MPKIHTVAVGECVSSIAEQYGFFSETIWNEPANASLKQKRNNPNMLVPGDRLTIPDKRMKEATKPTDARHKFRKKGVPVKFRLQLFSGETPRANQDYTFILDRRILLSGTTDGDGVLFAEIPPGVKEGKVEIGTDHFEVWIDFGTLAPIDTLQGIQQRLCNLGYSCEPAERQINDSIRKALRRFQKRFGLERTGEPDLATRQKLQEMHDAVHDIPPEEPSRAERS